MKRLRLCGLLFIVSCTGSVAPSTTRLVFPVRALRQALGIAVVPSGAVLAVACDDGSEETALPLALSDTTISFNDVAACGRAVLKLTVTTGSDNITTYVGTASAELKPGEVHVDFVGPLYGELVIASSSSPLICTGLGDPVTVDHTLTIALAIGPYALTCTDDGGFSASARVTVVAAARTPIALSFAAPTPSLVSLDVGAVGGQFFTPFVFVPGQATYALVATQATSQIVVSGLGEPSSAILAVNGDSRLPLTLAWSSASIDIVVSVTEGKRSTQVVIHIDRSPLSSDARILSLIGLPSPPTPSFASGVFDYTVVAASGTTGITFTGELSAGATATVNGQIAGQANSLSYAGSLLAGSTILAIHVTAADGLSSHDYVITITVAASNAADASLAGLMLSGGALFPSFSPSQASYTVLLSAANETLGFTATTSQSGATLAGVFQGGAITISAIAATTVPLGLGDNALSITVTSPDAAHSQKYSLTIHRGLLASVNVSGATLSPSLALLQANGGERFDVAMTVAAASLAVTVTTSDAAVGLTIGPQAITSGQSAAVVLARQPGFNIIPIVATLGAQSESYWMRVSNGAILTPGGGRVAVVTASGVSLHPIVSNIAQSLSGTLPLSTGHALAVDSISNCAFTVDSAGLRGTLLSSNGQLFGASTATQPMNNVTAMVVDPRGDYLFIVENGVLEAWSFNATTCQASIHDTLSLPGTVFLAADPQGRFVFTATGSQLQAVIHTDAGFVAAPGYAYAASEMAVDASGTTLYYSDQAVGQICAFGLQRYQKQFIGPTCSATIATPGALALSASALLVAQGATNTVSILPIPLVANASGAPRGATAATGAASDGVAFFSYDFNLATDEISSWDASATLLGSAPTPTGATRIVYFESY